MIRAILQILERNYVVHLHLLQYIFLIIKQSMTTLYSSYRLLFQYVSWHTLWNYIKYVSSKIAEY